MRPGTSGFCTVAYTQGMSPSTIQVLEALSAYRNLYDGHDPRAARNPVAYSHYRYTLDGRSVSVLSRVCFAGVDHTNRANKIAHHLVIDPRERPAGGPAWLARCAGVFATSWEGEPRQIEAPRELPQGAVETTFAAAWKAQVGDAGWAGVLAYAFESRPTVPAFLVFEPGMDALPLLAEALNLLAPDKRWQVTFSTYFSFLPAGTSCSWRCCVPDSDSLREGRRIPRALVIDLTKPLPPPPDNPLVRQAREATEPAPAREPAVPQFVKLKSSQRPSLLMRPPKPGGPSQE
jgi:hypothetical protein